MLILPKVPHHLRTLTSSVSRLINPAASAGPASAGPSVTFTSGTLANGNPIIGGGGPFTSNSFLVGGGALTKTGESAGGQLTFANWAPYSGGAGSGAGAGRSKAGAGHYGYTGHARAFISSAPTASDISNTLFEEDDQDVQAALALHRSKLRSSSVGPDARSAHIRLQKDGLKVVRLTTTLKLKDGRTDERVRMKKLMRETNGRYAAAAESARIVEEEDETAVGMEEETVSRLSRRPRGRSSTNYPLPFLRSASPLLASSADASGVQARAFSASPAVASSLQPTESSPDEVLVFTDDFDISINTAAPSTTTPRPSTPTPGSVTPKGLPLPLESEGTLESSLSTFSDSIPPPPPPSANETSSEPHLAASPPRDASQPLGLHLGPPPGLSLPSQPQLASEPIEPELELLNEVPAGYVDPAEAQHLDALRQASYARSIPDVIDASRTYSDLPGVQPLPGLARLPTQSTDSFNATLKTLSLARPAGAPIEELTEVWSTMLRKGVPPNIQSYAIMIRVLCERQLEVAETKKFVALNQELERQQAKAGGEKQEVINLLPPPSTCRFTASQPIKLVKKEDALSPALALFRGATTFPTLSSSVLPVDVYDMLIAACATAKDAALHSLSVFEHLKAAVEGQKEGLKYTYNTFAGLIGSYSVEGKMEDAETVLEGCIAAEGLQLIAVPAETTLPLDALRISPWNALITGHFANYDSASAIALVDTLIDPTSASSSHSDSALPPPKIQPSTFTAVVKGFLANDDLPSALEWFDKIAISDSALPDLEPATYILLLAHASKTKDVETYDHVFDRFTAHLPANYHLRPLEVAEAVNLHIAAAQSPTLTPDEVNSHLDRIFEFVARCDQHEQSRYLYPSIIADPLLRLLVQHARIEELQDVYFRTLRSGLEDVENPLAAVNFHAFFFESMVHWFTTPHAQPLSFNVTERLQLLGLLSNTAMSAGLPTDVSGEQIALRVLHLAEQAHIESRETLALNEGLAALVGEAQALEEHRYNLANPPVAPPVEENASQDIYADSVSGSATEVASQAGTNLGVSQSSSASVTTETPPSSVDEELLDLPPSFEDVPVPEEKAEEPFKYVVDRDLGEYIDAHAHATSSATRPTAVACYQALKRGMANGTVAPPRQLANLLGGLGRAREPELAAEVLELSHLVLHRTAPLNTKLWFNIENQAIIAFSHCGIMDRANFHRMNIINAGSAPSSDAYSALVNGAKDTTDDAAVARLLFQEAVQLGVEPNLFFYNTVISSLSKARKSEEAIGLFYEMQKKGLQPSTVTYGTIVNAFCRTGDPENAIKFFNTMCAQPKFKARVPPFNTMMQYFTLTQPDRPRVLHYYDRLVEAEVQPSSHTYNILMQAFGTIEPLDLRAMHKVFDTLKKNPHSDARVEGLHWATLINCHGAANKDLDTALHVFNSIIEHNAPSMPFGQKDLPDAVCWEAIFNVILIHRRFDLLAEYVDKMRVSGLQSTTYIQNVLIRALATEGNIEKARELFDSMVDPPMGIAAPHAHQNRKGRKKAPALPEGVVHREPSTYEIMVRAELAAGEHDRAVRLCERMEERMYPVSVTAKVRGVLGEDV